jgi:hypothetical protein
MVTRASAFVLASSVALAASSAYAQVPNAAAAINAARDAKNKTEAAQQKNSEALAATPAPTAGQAAPAPAGPPAQGTPPSGEAEPPGSGYTYDPAGRRDPFVSLLGGGSEVPTTGARPQGMAGVLIAELTVKGVMKTGKCDFVALLQAPDNKTYIAHAGEKVLDGAIKAITAGEVVFTQDVTDPLSLVKQREVRKGIRPEAR